jgi:tetratricopeptide (TPR) repeat protein
MQDMDGHACACGSGLRRSRCCALDAAAWPAAESAALLDAQAQNATALFNARKFGEAETLALGILDLAPNHRLALRVLFEIMKARRRPMAAEALVRRLAALPGPPALRAAANAQAAQYIIGQGRYEEATPAAAAAVMANPRDATAQHVLGVVLTESGRLRAGERHYRTAGSLLGREDGLVLGNTAWNLKLQGRLDEAAAIYARALALRPDNQRGIGGFAQVEFGRGNRAAALALLDDGLARFPQERTLRLLRALADIAMADPQAALARLADPPERLLGAELAARGQALSRLERPRDAARCFMAAKRTHRERNGQTYAPASFEAAYAANAAYFTATRTLPLPRATPPACQPVFLLGFPRSGTGLLEQLLMQVPGFNAADEALGVAELIPRIDGAYPQGLDHLLVAEGQELPERLRVGYEARRAAAGFVRENTVFVTDRHPKNLWHLGVIKLLFPDAPIIHVLRHPLDVALSNLAEDRRLEGDCGVSLTAIARHYALSMRMIAHYRGQLTLRYLSVRYEDLVADTAATLRRVLGFMGANIPAGAGLAANTAPRQDPTPQHFALREPVHARSLYRYRVYEDALPALFEDIRDTLDPWIAELGYGDAA